MIEFKKIKIRKEFAILFIIMIVVSAIVQSFANFNTVETKKVFVYSHFDSDVLNVSYNKDYIQRLNEYNNEFIKNNKSSIYSIDITPGHGNTASYFLSIKYNQTNEEKVNNSNILINYKAGLEKIDGVFEATISNFDTFHYNYSLSLIYKIIGIIIFFLTLILMINKIGIKNNFLLGLVYILPIAGVMFNFLFILTAFNIAVLLLLKIIRRNEKDAKYIIGIFSLALVLRLLGTAVMLIYNNYSFNSLFAYVQPDEINYYNTAIRISNYFMSGTMPDILQIVGFKQFGYNIFLAFVNMMNGELFFVSKIINILVSGFISVLTYVFVKELFDEKAAKLSGFIVCLMPTMIMFSAYTLRDVIIVILIMIILYLTMRQEKLTAGAVMILLASIISLWFLRNYTVLIICMVVMLYKILGYARKKHVNPIIMIVVIIAGSFAFFQLTSKVYNFNTFNTIYNYFKFTGVIPFLQEFVLSLVNLDFLVNSTATSYGKSTIIRMFYPDTLFLILSFPFFIVGIIKGYKINKILTISLLVLFPVFIILYKIYYDGWFLRTQIQVLPIQVAFISLGIIDVFGERYDKLVLWTEKSISGILQKKNDAF
jgi:hypothetical protein